MLTCRSTPARRGATAAGTVLSLAVAPMTLLLMTFGGSPSAAVATPVDLGTAGSYGVLAGQTVTNTGNTVIAGDLGVSPGTAVTGFPPGIVLGDIDEANAAAGQAQSDLTIAYNAVASQASDATISADLAGQVLTTGVYTSASTMGLSGQLTLDAQGDPSALFVFQVGSALDIATGSTVLLTNGAQACNVFWQVGSSAELKTGATFVGTILALTSISVGDSVTVVGRLLARNGSVTLINDSITVPTCAPPTTTDGTTTDGTTSDGPGTDGSGTDGADSEQPNVSHPSVGRPGVGQPGGEQPEGDLPQGDQLETQIQNVPAGAPDTGGGGPRDQSNWALIGAGSLALLLAGGLLAWWRRETQTD